MWQHEKKGRALRPLLIHELNRDRFPCRCVSKTVLSVGRRIGRLTSDTWRHLRERISPGDRAHGDLANRNVRSARPGGRTDILYFFTLKYARCNELSLRTVRKTCLIRCLGNWLTGIQNVLAIIYFGYCPERIPNSSTIRVKNITDTIFGFFFPIPSLTEQHSTYDDGRGGDVRWFSRDCSRHQSMKNDNR